MAHRNARDLDATHNTAIRKEIGYRLRAGLMREPTNPPQCIQYLLGGLKSSLAEDSVDVYGTDRSGLPEALSEGSGLRRHRHARRRRNVDQVSQLQAGGPLGSDGMQVLRHQSIRDCLRIDPAGAFDSMASHSDMRCYDISQPVADYPNCCTRSSSDPSCRL
jgi:hypothetical protein